MGFCVSQNDEYSAEPYILDKRLMWTPPLEEGERRDVCEGKLITSNSRIDNNPAKCRALVVILFNIYPKFQLLILLNLYLYSWLSSLSSAINALPTSILGT